MFEKAVIIVLVSHKKMSLILLKQSNLSFYCQIKFSKSVYVIETYNRRCINSIITSLDTKLKGKASKFKLF